MVSSVKPGARRLFEQVYEVYEQCSTYRDVGEIVTSLIDEGGVEIRAKRRVFSTRFARPGKFLFTCEDRVLSDMRSKGACAILASGMGVQSWIRHSRDRCEHEDLLEATDRLVGCTSGASVRIPRMLLQIDTAKRNYDSPLVDSAIVTTEQSHVDTDFLLVSGQSALGALVQYRIDPQTNLIHEVTVHFSHEADAARRRNAEAQEAIRKDHRISENDRKSLLRTLMSLDGAIGNFSSKTTTVYKPRLDEELATCEFSGHAIERLGFDY